MEKSPFVRTTAAAVQPQTGPRQQVGPGDRAAERSASGAAVARVRSTDAGGTVLRGTLRTGGTPVLPAEAPVTAAVEQAAFRRSAGPTGENGTTAPQQTSASGSRKAHAASPAPAQNLAAAFAAAERARQAAERSAAGGGDGTAAPQQTSVSGTRKAHAASPAPAQNLAAAFAAAEQARQAAERSAAGAPAARPVNADNTAPPQTCLRTAVAGDRCADAPAPDYAALEAALLRGIGWGSEAGSTLTNSAASAMLLDWGEDNRAAHQSQTALTIHIRSRVEQLDCCAQQNLRENWPRIAHHADELVRSTVPSAGRLVDAGSPNRRTDYSPVHWAAVKQAVEQALNGAEAAR